MNREQKRRRFNEALVNMLYPQPPPSPVISLSLSLCFFYCNVDCNCVTLQPEEEEKPVKLLEEEFAVDLTSGFNIYIIIIIILFFNFFLE